LVLLPFSPSKARGHEIFRVCSDLNAWRGFHDGEEGDIDIGPIGDRPAAGDAGGFGVPGIRQRARLVGRAGAGGDIARPASAWLYVIGIGAYKNVQRLETPVVDAKSVRDLLIEKYQFDRAHLMERYDGAATRENILNDLYELAGKMGQDDSLLIYYAGHGIEDKRLNQGYWLPVDGKSGNIVGMISNADIRTALAGIPARHIWLVSDSCFSETLLADRAVPDLIDDRYYRKKYKLPSRMILTSGGKEPVADRSGCRDCRGHSVFACYFLKSLRGSAQPYLTPNEVFIAVGRNVSINSDQTPVLGTLRQAGDEGGEFVLVARIAVFQAGKKVDVILGEASIGPAYAAPDVSDYYKLLKDAEKQEAERKQAEEARKKHIQNSKPYGLGRLRSRNGTVCGWRKALADA